MNFESISSFELFSVRQIGFNGASLPVSEPKERPL